MISVITSVIYENKITFIILGLALAALLGFILYSLAFQVDALEISGISTFRYCVGSGGVCTGG